MRKLIATFALLLLAAAMLAGCASSPAYNPDFTDNVALPPPDTLPPLPMGAKPAPEKGGGWQWLRGTA